MVAHSLALEILPSHIGLVSEDFPHDVMLCIIICEDAFIQPYLVIVFTFHHLSWNGVFTSVRRQLV